MSKPPKADQAGPPSGLSAVSARWLEQSDAGSRKLKGQYMTPRPIAQALVDRIPLSPGMRVLDPGVGTGELLRAVLDREPTAKATGWDIDPGVLTVARELVPEARLDQRSALEAEPEADGAIGIHDVVIGNPPYFQLRLDSAGRRRFAGVISGRVNIFALFFQVGFEQLRPGGTLAFIVPPSMNSGAYFEALREFISDRADIRDLTILEGTDHFEGANTAAQLLVLESREPESPVGRKTRGPGHNPTHRDFVFEREVGEAGFRRVLFTFDRDRMAAEFAGRRTLWELGLEAVTGQVIWNENRDRLRDGPGPGRVPLIWSRDIGEGELRPAASGPGTEGKPGFYDTSAGGKSPLTGPAIVVNRVVGAVGRGELRAALVEEGEQFLAENHVNVIRRRSAGITGGSENAQSWSQSDPPIEWEGVLASLRAPGVVERVRLLTGNTQISARELTHLLPLDCPAGGTVADRPGADQPISRVR